jgi:hypothetical protein
MKPAFQSEGLDQHLPFTKICTKKFYFAHKISRLRVDINVNLTPMHKHMHKILVVCWGMRAGSG